MDTRGRLWLERSVLLLIAAVLSVGLLELWLLGVLLLVDTFRVRPVLGTVLYLLVGLGVVLCYKGTRLESRRVIRFLSRLVLLIFTFVVVLVSVEVLTGTAIAAAVGHGASLEDNLSLLLPLALVCIATAGLKFALGLRVRYWILLIVMVGVVLLVTLAGQALIFLG